MRGNSFGSFFTVTTFGESHGAALGAVMDGVPAGIALAEEDFAAALRRRRPGQSDAASQRREPDEPHILSGVFHGLTVGTPVCVVVRNEDARPGDYDPAVYRAGHGDRAWERKYGLRDHRGGGRASGRETVARVIAGVVAEKILPPGLRIVAFTTRIGPVAAGAVPEELTRELVDAHPTRCPDPAAAGRMLADIARCRAEGNSLGGVAELRIDGAPAGLGEPVFRKLKSQLAAAMMSIGGVTAVALGDAWNDLALDGAAYHEIPPGFPEGFSPRGYGIQGGISTGGRVTMQILVKPPSTTGAMALAGRHDPCLLPRIVPVAEAMAAIVLADLWLASRTDRMSDLAGSGSDGA